MKKGNALIAASLTAVMLLSGCSFNNSKTTTNTNTSNTAAESSQLKPIDTKALTSLLQKLQTEKGVLTTNTSRDGDTVIIDISLNKDADSKNAKQLAEKYAKQFKELYNAKKAVVNISQDKKKITSVTAD